MAQPPTKKQRDVMQRRLSNPYLVSQSEAMRQLKIKDSNTYYRIFERSIIVDRKKQLEAF